METDDAQTEILSTDTPSQLSVFAHINAERSGDYRAILEIFARSREQFIIHLRPSEVLQEIARLEPGNVSVSELSEVEMRLQQLATWGNLLATRDSSEVSSVEDFYRPRYLYQFSAEGEAAEAALKFYFQQIHQPGELQTAALGDIILSIQEIETLLAAAECDDAKLMSAFRGLVDRFEELTSRAQTFMRSLQQTIDLYGISVEDFLSYKEMLIGYLERFIGELVTATNQISERLSGFDRQVMEAVWQRLAGRELVDALDPNEEMRARSRLAWQQRWQGLNRWFRGETGKASQAEILRHRARSAIPSLLATLANINDRRSSRSDRSADWKELAVWFAEADESADMHCLWRAAFSLNPSRHYVINDETLASREDHPISPKTSWLQAEPVWITPRLRQSGRAVHRGPARSIVNRSAAKQELQRLNEQQAEQIRQARDTLATNRRMRLSEVKDLDRYAFELFLDLLGEALTKKFDPDDSVMAPSSDGSLSIFMEPIPEAGYIAIETKDGALRGRDHWITIKNTFQASEATS
ncbi:MAG: TIGR02677 family protein [Verrucomicrobiota bacterium]